MHTHFTSFTAIHSTRESRLCFETVEGRDVWQAKESVEAVSDIRSNPNLADLLDTYDNPLLRANYPELRDPVQRNIFYALLLENSVRLDMNAGYKTVSRAEVHLYLPIGMRGYEDGGTSPAPESLGRHLQSILSEEDLAELLGPNAPDNIKNDSTLSQKIGQAYIDRYRSKERDWQALTPGTKLPPDPLLVRTAIEHYRKGKADMDAILVRRGIRIPGVESRSAVPGVEKNLTREDYMILLHWYLAQSLTVNPSAILDGEAVKGLEGIKALIEAGVPGGEGKTRDRLKGMYTDLTAVELGAEESLRGFGIQLGEDLRNNYINILRSPEGSPYLRPGEDASVWLTHPDRAAAFLRSTSFASTLGNNKFLTALEFYVGNNWANYTPDSPDELQASSMSQEDVKAILHVMVRSLSEASGVMRSSFEQLKKMKEERDIAETIEQYGADFWEYMKDFREHPVGSGLAWIAAIMAARKAYKLIFTDEKKPRWQSWLLNGTFVAGGGLLVGLFQKHRGGDAWWDTMLPKMGDWMGKERKEDVSLQTLPTYWTHELFGKEGAKPDPEVSEKKSEVCLAVLQDQKITTVLDFYSQMAQWENGGRNGKPPPLPFRVSGYPQFAKMDGKQKSIVFYKVIRRFLEDRGNAVRGQEPVMRMFPVGLDSAGLGYAYLRERYVEQTYFVRLAEVVNSSTITVEGITIDLSGPDAQQGIELLRQKSPEMVVVIQEIQLRYKEAIAPRETCDWEFWNVLLQEANPEIIGRYGRNGTEPASFLQQMSNYGKKLGESIVPPRSPIEDEPRYIAKKREIESHTYQGVNAGLSVSVDPEGKIIVSLGKYARSFGIADFFTTDKDAILDSWRNDAFSIKKRELDVASGTNPSPYAGIVEFHLNSLQAEDVLYQGSTNDPVARSSIYKLLMTEKDDIYRKYVLWQVSATGDPLDIP